MIDPQPDPDLEADFTEEVEPVIHVVDASGFKPRRRETAEEIFLWMKARLKFVGSPLPQGYVPPPGIDIDALLRQLPPPPPRPGA